MKLHSIDRSSTVNKTAFRVRKNSYANFLKIWHYHPELELVYILQSSGTRFIGDSIEKFDKGDLVLIGKNLPHMWLNDEAYFLDNSKLKAEAIAFHFKEDFLGKDFFNLEETKSIQQMMRLARRGICFQNVDEKLIRKIKKTLTKEPMSKLLDFIDILKQLSEHKDYKVLAGNTYHNTLHNKSNLDEVYNYIFNNFNKQLQLAEIAAIVNMNPSAFSRYFKKVNRKTLSKYINEIRIGYACKKLKEGDLTITQICYESGYNSLSNFNKQFKNITGKTPSEYISLSSKLT